MYRIFIVEDDSKISAVLKRNIEKYGFDASCVTGFRDIMPELKVYEPHLVMLDINLPYFDGYYWCRQIRKKSNLPIIFISARAGEMDQVLAIDNGGDDYITKPIHLDLLIAKIKGVLRRVYGDYSVSTGLAPSPENELNVQGLRLNLSRNELTWQKRKTEITKNEQLLAECFMQQYGKTVSRDQLLGTLWDNAQFMDDNTLTVNIGRLRKKLEALGLPSAITTVRGMGYKLIFDFEQGKTSL
ncbi:response regulator transcription factor [Bacillus nitratireducens]|uniref:Response regulator transcription factor n=1 Tax=Bacillus nitratireducens TaxID=2026193 RepID=A0ABU6PKK9_9BACI|nr:response regulator transcription factor [Bacillus nitratireducens]MDR4173942.1 response regulator transcription factor [Bacillus nitratireducens]MED4681835.1 response regulator transcription factor [Bacillus nitratireducens]PGW32366.1 DNA-binding response regulator [Bacillus cereus]